MTNRVEITHSHLDQNFIWFYGRHVGYCGTEPDMPICFLQDVALCDDDKRAIVEAVIKHHNGRVMQTQQTRHYFPRMETSHG